MLKNAFLFLSSLLLIGACNEESDPKTTDDLPEVFDLMYGATDVYVDGNYIIIKSTGLPDHKSPYYIDTEWESALYQAYNGSNANFNLNPNRIDEFSYTFKIPKSPAVASSHSSTPGGPIGVSLNGVPFFNQYAAMGAALTGEINSFDQYNGHPQQQGGYHYHVEPLYLTSTKGKTALLGFLLDGFPVYGPMEDGVAVVNADLDAYHGHTHATTEYPDGIYHYHITTADPYINGSGFYGTAGTVSF
jgi:YHYH protein